MDLSLGYDETKVFDLFAFDFAFFGFDIKFVFVKEVKNLLCDYPVFFYSFRVNDDVIDEDGDVSFSNEISEYMVHHCLECGRGVC